MNKLIKTIKNSVIRFSRDEEGAQVVEYALIIAVVSIALTLALSKIAAGEGPFTDFISRVTSCLTSATCK